MSQGERRLAAIMFTDIVGYAALTQADESQALEVLERHNRLLRPLFLESGGREIKTMGDSFLVEFGSALDATKCAISIQTYLHDYNLSTKEEWKVKLRIGVHLGDVVHRTNDVLGDAVNIASRIEPLADPEGICISEQVYDQVRNKLELSLVKLDAPRLKNLSVPLDVYRVLMPWAAGTMTQAAPLDHRRIAVLPFANISQDPGDEYFADGMTEELITAMSGLQGFQVIARTSVMNYKGEKTKLSKIGNDLNVGTILEGSIRKAGNKVRVTAQLIDVPTESHIWSEKYDRELDDIFKIQDDIAGKIAQALKVRLTAAQEPGRRHTENMEAYTLYLKGRSLWSKRSKEGVLESLKMFERATQMDPQYVKAYAGLADAYYIAAVYGFMDRGEGLAKSKEMATLARGLDDTFAEAHASLGINLYEELRYDEARRELNRAIELNPSYATARHWYCLCMRELGRMEEAMEEIKIARELDPLSPVITDNVGETNLLLGRLDEAIAIYDKLIDNEPSWGSSYIYRAFCYEMKGMKEKAYADLEAMHKLLGFDDGYKVCLAVFCGWFEEGERALPIIEELIQRVGKSSVWETDIAACYAAVGNRDEFFRWMDGAISAKRISSQIGGVSAARLRMLPMYDKMRDDPRFPEIFKKLGLPYKLGVIC